MSSLCNTSSLEVYTPSLSMPWNETRARHLFKRAVFGADPQIIQDALTKSPTEVVDELILQANNQPLLADPGWGYWNKSEFNERFIDEFAPGSTANYIGITNWRNELMYITECMQGGIKGRMLFFWFNHFVSESLRIPPFIFQKTQIFQHHALGNFKEFVHAMGRTNSMILYLNRNQNKSNSVNENFARELFELFTLGVDNGYTENDIMEAARALTGFTTQDVTWSGYYFNEAHFDNGDKTIFGQTGNWGYDDVIDILFEQKGDLVAHYICRKIYKNLVSFDVNEDIVAGLAQVMLNNNFEILPVVTTLFKSKHFFNDYAIGTLIKSPQELLFGMYKDIKANFDASNEYTLANNNGYTRMDVLFRKYDAYVFSYPDVSGFPGDVEWLDTYTMIQRWGASTDYVYQIWRYNRDVFSDFVLNNFSINDSSETVCNGIIDHFMPKGFKSQLDYDIALAVFQEGVPEIYFEDGTWDIDYPDLKLQVRNLMYHIVKLPEFNLS